MSIEENYFKKNKIDYKKLMDYGFTKQKNSYIFTKTLIDNFKVIINIKENKINGKIIDEISDEEYTNFRLETRSGYSSLIREKYEEILQDIASKCCSLSLFNHEQTNRINGKIKDLFKDNPEFLWKKSKETCIYRNPENKKWYGLITSIDINILDKNKKGKVEIMNLKLDPIKIEQLLTVEGFYKAYHMNKKYWITLLLNNTHEDTLILELIKESHSYTEKKRGKNEK